MSDTSAAHDRVSRLKIKDFHCFDDLDVALPDDEDDDDDGGSVFVIFGDNGVGKTSLLEALLIGIGRQNLILTQDHMPCRIGTHDFGIEATIERRVAGDRCVRVVKATHKLMAWGRLESDVNAVYVSTRRDCFFTVDQMVRAIVKAHADDRPRFDRMRQFLSVFMSRDKATIDVVKYSEHSEEMDVVLESERCGTTVRVSIDSLGDGIHALLGFACAILSGEREPDIMVIDNIEFGLHPSWQRALLSALRTLSPQTQFIVTTHSDHVIGSVLSSERLMLRNGES